MKRLSKLETIVMAIGALLSVFGVMIYVVSGASWACWLFLVGALAFLATQERQTYEGRYVTIDRLRRIVTRGDLCWVLSAFLVAEDVSHILYSVITSMWTNGYYFYVSYIHNNWVIPLIVAVVIELYTTIRISSELQREAKKT